MAILKFRMAEGLFQFVVYIERIPWTKTRRKVLKKFSHIGDTPQIGLGGRRHNVLY